MLRCLGILRELQNSPNRESDDALILQEVLEQAGILGIKGRLVTPEDFDREERVDFHLLLPMCESYPRLIRLKKMAAESTALWINSPEAVLNCYRTHMVPILLNLRGIRFPASEIRRVEQGTQAPPKELHAQSGFWLKRGDVHNTCDRDVVFVHSWSQTEPVLRDFAEREISHYIVQPHLEGDLVKFYGVGPGKWFTWFYHNPMLAQRFSFHLDELALQATLAAQALKLEIFGGDALIDKNGAITLIDINSWPSFALVRREAAVQIAWHLQSRLKSQASYLQASETNKR